ncbi:histidine phosphatase family protein [Pedobacter sp. SYP-B3415]|uniref:SixA phosphatase family protein n=1 Tax=Pedobacter sp. SYP-B3415 TaxID=2496641 RepID=UPI00101DBFC1|nr:histidine phosphatase family protein [Pedobacter sp. SYP-B3415]
MNKQILLLRHGEASHKPGQDDFDRALTAQGREEVRVMAGKILALNIPGLQVFSSPARRALDTAILLAEALGFDPASIGQLPSVYEASVSTLLRVVNAFNHKTSHIVLVGHNPGLTELANYLSDAGIYNIPTAGAVLISFPFDDWKLISKGTGRMIFTDEPGLT